MLLTECWSDVQYGFDSTICIFLQLLSTCRVLVVWFQLNLDRLLARMWDEMGLVRVYTKPQGQQPDFSEPVVLSTVSYDFTVSAT